MPNDNSASSSISQRVQRALKEARTTLEAQEYARTEPIAVIGIGCRFPGGADNPEAFWQLLHDGVDGVTPVPDGRWDIDGLYDSAPATPGKMYLSRGGFLPQIDQFDAHFFQISPREAMSMDPQHRLLLEVAWEALEHAALAPDTLRQTRTGVFVGMCQNDYARFELNSGNLQAISAYSGTGNLLSFAPGRLAYLLGLQGPTMAVDTACSSSLVAVHLACNALRNKEADTALACGVHLVLTPEISVFLSMSRALAPDGISKTFDADANGFTRGEGCGVVVLKRLSDALANGDRILALIRGSAVNHDGPSSGLTVPSEEAQAQVIRQALHAAKVTPDDMDYIEAHGTGTSLGDPIELSALASVFCQDRPPDRPLWIGSVKTNVGHLEGAAGIISLIKVVLSMVHGEIPPHLHFNTPNPRIDWAKLPISVPTQVTPWPVGENRLAGISSFGMSGVNAHLVVGHVTDHQPRQTPAHNSVNPSPQFLALAAKSESALTELANRFEAHLAANPDLAIEDVCYTANTGRAHFHCRLGIIAASLTELCQKLHAYRSGLHLDGVFTGQDHVSWQAAVAFKPASPNLDLEALGKAYARGDRIDWRVLYQHVNGQKLSLPTYPFHRERYWVETPPTPTPDAGTTPQILGSQSNGAVLIGRQLSLPFSNEIRFEANFTPQSPPYMAHHRVFGELVVPAASHVSMVLSGVKAGLKTNACVIEEALFTQAMILAPDRGRTVQLIFSPMQDQLFSFRIISREDGAELDAADQDASWMSHVTGHVRLISEDLALPQSTPIDVADVKGGCDKPPIAGHEFYADLENAGFDLGPPFQWGESLWHRRDEVLCRIQTPELHENVSDYAIYPGLLDTCFQMSSAFWEMNAQDLATANHLYVPFSIARLAFHRSPVPDRQLWCHATTPTAGGPDTASELCLFDEHGAVYVEVSGFKFRRASRETMLQSASGRSGDWLQTVEWVEAPSHTPAPIASGNRWLLVSNANDLASGVVRLLEQQGDECLIAVPETEAAMASHDRFDPRRGSDYQRLLEKTGPVQRVVHLWREATAEVHTPISGCESVLNLVQALAKTGWPLSPTLSIVTHGVHSIPATPSTPEINQAPVWGLARVLQLEHPELACVLVDLPSTPADKPLAEGPDDAKALVQALLSPGQENQMALRHGKRYAPRFVKHRMPDATSHHMSEQRFAAGVDIITAAGSYLITGGLGALGLRVAQWLVGSGARYLILVGRRTASDQVVDTIRQLESAGAQVWHEPVDVADPRAMAQLFDTIRDTMPPLRGIIHAAGVLDDAIILRQDRDKLEKVFAPKVQGAWHLHTLTEQLPLDFMIYFSSTASMFGSRGQGNYAAANAYLDALAHYRRSLGLVGLSINWGPWANVGMAANVEQRSHFAGWAELGLDPMDLERGFDILGRLLRDAEAQVGAVGINWPKLSQTFFRGSPPAIFQAFHAMSDAVASSASSPSTLLPTQAEGQSELLEQLKAGLPAERRAQLTTYVSSQIAGVLRISPDAIQPRQGLFSTGLDSLMAIELKEKLESGLGLPLPQTLLFDYPSIEAIVGLLMGKLEIEDPPRAGEHLGRPRQDSTPDRETTSPFQVGLDLQTLLAESGQMTESDIVKKLVGEASRHSTGDMER